MGGKTNSRVLWRKRNAGFVSFFFLSEDDDDDALSIIQQGGEWNQYSAETLVVICTARGGGLVSSPFATDVTSFRIETNCQLVKRRNGVRWAVPKVAEEDRLSFGAKWQSVVLRAWVVTLPPATAPKVVAVDVWSYSSSSSVCVRRAAAAPWLLIANWILSAAAADLLLLPVRKKKKGTEGRAGLIECQPHIHPRYERPAVGYAALHIESHQSATPSSAIIALMTQCCRYWHSIISRVFIKIPSSIAFSFFLFSSFSRRPSSFRARRRRPIRCGSSPGARRRISGACRANGGPTRRRRRKESLVHKISFPNVHLFNPRPFLSRVRLGGVRSRF